MARSTATTTALLALAALVALTGTFATSRLPHTLVADLHSDGACTRPAAGPGLQREVVWLGALRGEDGRARACMANGGAPPTPPVATHTRPHAAFPNGLKHIGQHASYIAGLHHRKEE